MKQMKKFSLLVLTLISFPYLSYAEENQIGKNDFKYISEFKTNPSENRLNQIHLQDNVIEKSENNLADLRIYDKKANEIPYIILDNIIPKEKKETYTLKISEYSAVKNQEEIIASLPDKSRAIALLDINTENIDFKKNVKVSGSNDLKQWSFVTSQDIYDFTSNIPLRKTEIKFNKSNYKYYKLVLTNNTSEKQDRNLQLEYKDLNLSINETNNKNFHIESITASTSENNDEDIVYDSKVFKNFEMKSENKRSYIILNANLPFNKISFKINNNYYYREINVYYADKDIKEAYNSIFKDNIYKIPIDKNEEKTAFKYVSTKHKFYKIEIENLDNPPLQIKEIKLEWVRKNLFFMQEDNQSDYGLYLGNENINMPIYDFSTLINKDNWYKQNYQTVNITDLESNKDFKNKFSREDNEKIQQNILTFIICFISLILGIWLYKMLKDTKVKNE